MSTYVGTAAAARARFARVGGRVFASNSTKYNQVRSEQHVAKRTSNEQRVAKRTSNEQHVAKNTSNKNRKAYSKKNISKNNLLSKNDVLFNGGATKKALSSNSSTKNNPKSTVKNAVEKSNSKSSKNRIAGSKQQKSVAVKQQKAAYKKNVSLKNSNLSKNRNKNSSKNNKRVASMNATTNRAKTNQMGPSSSLCATEKTRDSRKFANSDRLVGSGKSQSKRTSSGYRRHGDSHHENSNKKRTNTRQNSMSKAKFVSPIADIKLALNSARRSHRKSKAGRAFTKQFGFSNASDSSQDVSRAAVYKTQMGQSHKKSMRMQSRSDSNKVASNKAAVFGIKNGFTFSIPSFFSSQKRIATVSLAAMCVVAVCLFLYTPVQQLYQASREYDKLQAEYAAVENRNAELKNMIANYESDDGIKNVAREELGWVEKGDNSVTVLGLGDGTPSSSTVEGQIVSDSVKAPNTWYSPILDVVFGVSG